MRTLILQKCYNALSDKCYSTITRVKHAQKCIVSLDRIFSKRRFEMGDSSHILPITAAVLLSIQDPFNEITYDNAANVYGVHASLICEYHSMIKEGPNITTSMDLLERLLLEQESLNSTIESISVALKEILSLQIRYETRIVFDADVELYSLIFLATKYSGVKVKHPICDALEKMYSIDLDYCKERISIHEKRLINFHN